MDGLLPAGFDYAKFGASFIALVVAVLGIAFKYKLVSRSDDPAQPEKEKLSGLGVVAIVLVLMGGGFSIYSDARSQSQKQAESRKERQDLAAAREAQAALNRTTDSLLREMRSTLAQMREAGHAPGTARPDTTRTPPRPFDAAPRGASPPGP